MYVGQLCISAGGQCTDHRKPENQNIKTSQVSGNSFGLVDFDINLLAWQDNNNNNNDGNL